jgi:hypothetical protein
VSAPKVADVVCAQNFFRRKGTKPILQVTVAFGAIVNNESQPSPSNSSEIYAQAADGQLNDGL